MKRILFILGLLAATCLTLQAENTTVTDTLNGKKRVIELSTTLVDGKQVTDTVSITTYENENADIQEESGTYYKRSYPTDGWNWDKIGIDNHLSEMIIAIVAIIFIFGLPALLIFIIFYFRYKNRKAKYRLAEMAMEKGQQLPPEFFEHTETKDLRSRGIKNIFLGLGLFIFLWAILDFGIACIGLLVMFTGFGQIIIYYTQPGNRPDIHIERDETTGRRSVKVGGIEITNQKKNEDTSDRASQNEPQS